MLAFSHQPFTIISLLFSEKVGKFLFFYYIFRNNTNIKGDKDQYKLNCVYLLLTLIICRFHFIWLVGDDWIYRLRTIGIKVMVDLLTM